MQVEATIDTESFFVITSELSSLFLNHLIGKLFSWQETQAVLTGVEVSLHGEFGHLKLQQLPMLKTRYELEVVLA